MSMRETLDALYEGVRKLDLMRAEMADERIDAERASWLGTLLADYERLLRLEERVRKAVEYGETCRDVPEFSSGYCVAPDIWDAMKACLSADDPSAYAEMLREMWGMHRGLLKIHGQYPPVGNVNETEDDLPL